MFKPTLSRLAIISTVAAGSLALVACGPRDKAPEAGPDNAVVVTETAAQNVTPITGEWAQLEPLIGEYPNQSGLFDDSAITPALKTLLGDKFDTFKTNMQVQSPLTQDGSVLFTSGNKQHEGGSEMAYLIIDPSSKALEVGLWEGGVLSTFMTPGANLTKPADIQTMITNATS